jgi:positive regulator of sigma E activity
MARAVDEETGRVVHVADDHAVVELDPAACCGACGLCNAVAGKMRLELPTGDLPDDMAAALRPGRSVVVGVPRGVPATSMLLVFGLPLLGLVGGALLGYSVPVPTLGRDLSAAVFGIGLLAVALVVAIVADRRLGHRLPRPRLLRIED